VLMFEYTPVPPSIPIATSRTRHTPHATRHTPHATRHTPARELHKATNLKFLQSTFAGVEPVFLFSTRPKDYVFTRMGRGLNEGMAEWWVPLTSPMLLLVSEGDGPGLHWTYVNARGL
jgi:hypothetical protein